MAEAPAAYRPRHPERSAFYRLVHEPFAPSPASFALDLEDGLGLVRAEPLAGIV